MVSEGGLPTIGGVGWKGVPHTSPADSVTGAWGRTLSQRRPAEPHPGSCPQQAGR